MVLLGNRKPALSSYPIANLTLWHDHKNKNIYEEGDTHRCSLKLKSEF